jgi:hypothetical protein
MKNLSVWIIPCAASLLAAQSSARADEYRGTFEQRMACTPDVFRLCSAAVPDANRIVACLRQNTAQLGDACRAVFEAQNSAPPNPPQPAHASRASH